MESGDDSYSGIGEVESKRWEVLAWYLRCDLDRGRHVVVLSWLSYIVGLFFLRQHVVIYWSGLTGEWTLIVA